jgi:hypothetical protein
MWYLGQRLPRNFKFAKINEWRPRTLEWSKQIPGTSGTFEPLGSTAVSQVALFRHPKPIDQFFLMHGPKWGSRYSPSED